jgi:hypothetical protein
MISAAPTHAFPNLTMLHPRKTITGCIAYDYTVIILYIIILYNYIYIYYNIIMLYIILVYYYTIILLLHTLVQQLHLGCMNQNDILLAASCCVSAAAGTGIFSSFNRNDADTEVLSGTSMAAPHVAGMATLLFNAFPGRCGAESACGGSTLLRLTSPK